MPAQTIVREIVAGVAGEIIQRLDRGERFEREHAAVGIARVDPPSSYEGRTARPEVARGIDIVKPASALVQISDRVRANNGQLHTLLERARDLKSRQLGASPPGAGEAKTANSGAGPGQLSDVYEALNEQARLLDALREEISMLETV